MARKLVPLSSLSLSLSLYLSTNNGNKLSYFIEDSLTQVHAQRMYREISASEDTRGTPAQVA